MAPTTAPKAPAELPAPHSFVAEDVASAVLARIVKKGGDHLYEKYIDRKSYEFARDVVTTNATCTIEMHNPAHEDKDIDDEWAADADPPPLGSDNWLRMGMPRRSRAASSEEVVEDAPEIDKVFAIGGVVRNVVRRLQKRNVHRRGSKSASSAGNSDSQNSSISGTLSSKTSKANDFQMPTGYRHLKDQLVVPPSMGMRPLRDHRAWVIRDDWVADDDEDKLRLAMVRDEQQRILDEEEQRQARLDEEAAVAAEERRRMVDALDMRPRTYDVDGRIIWIQEPDPELLPNVQALAEIEIESRESDFQAIVQNFQSLPCTKAPPPPKEAVVSPKNKNRLTMRRGSIKKTQESVFTDTFYKPDYMQPPVLETMKVKPGVVLACMGSQKGGPSENRGRLMTRKEYIQRTQENRPASADGGGGSRDGDGIAETAKRETAKKERPSSAPGGGRDWKPPIFDWKRQISDPSPKADVSGAKSDVDLTKVVQSHGPSAPKPLIFIGGSAEDNAKAPLAPAWSVRNTGRALKMDARPPRFHVSPLGACLRSGPVQPPLGATMGHGLMRNGSLKDDYYFPSGSTSPAAAGPPSSPASTRGTPSSRDLPSRRPSSAMSRTNSEPALPRGALWAAAVPGSSASITASPSSGQLRSASAARPASASRPTSASCTRPASASGRRCVGSAKGQGTANRIKAS